MEISSIDLNLVVHLQALLKERSVSRAAKRNNITQSAMSNALKRLRLLFQDELLTRVGNDMLLTPRAELLQSRLPSCLETLEGVIFENAKFDPTADRARFRLGFHGYEEAVIFPILLSSIQEFEHISISSISPTSIELPKDLIEGRVELVTSPYVINSAGVKRVKIIEDDFVCIFSPSRLSEEFDITSFCGAKHLLISPSGEPVGMVDEELSKRDLARKVVATVSDFNNAPLVLFSRPELVCCAPRKLASLWASRYTLSIAEIPFKVPPFSIYLNWHERWEFDPRSKWMRERIRKLCSVRAKEPVPTLSKGHLT